MNASDDPCPHRQGYNPRTGAYHLFHDWDGDAPIVETVLRSVAAITNLDPTELDSPTHAVDTDALNALFRPLANGHGRGSGYVSFPLNGCDIVVHADGEVEIHPPVISMPRVFGDIAGDDQP